MDIVKKKQQFVKPAVLQELSLLPDAPILQASVVDDVTVISTGQGVETHDGSDGSFNFEWE